MAVTCRCQTTPCSCSGSAVACDPTPTYPPTSDPIPTIACTILGGLQDIIDDARRFTADVVGTDGYIARLVWQEQDQVTGKWSRVYEKAIDPVTVSFGRESLETMAAGLVPNGVVTLTQISPLVFDEDLLRGYIDGQQWTGPTREYFYEIQRRKMCSTSREPERYRFALASVPEHRPTRHEYVVRVMAQFGRRERDGTDSTVPGDFYPPIDGAQLVS